jgi:hypothetical protein
MPLTWGLASEARVEEVNEEVWKQRTLLSPR